MSTFSHFKRFLHWGPLTALSIIKCITLTSLYINSMWWPPNLTIGGFLNQIIFLFLSLVASYNFMMATITGPGLLPKNWQPKNPNDVHQMQYCKVCEGYKAPRSHHCRSCKRCVKKMDHHCPWINHCVGWANHAYFIYFLSFSIIGSLHATIILCCGFYRGIHRYWYLTHGQFHLANVQFSMFSIVMCIFSMGLSIGVVIALGMLLYFQMKSVVKNQTGIEMWIIEKAFYRRFRYDNRYAFVYPYNLGLWQNLQQVFNTRCVKTGEGIEWPIVDGCDQYTLTREQIAQKVEKRARTKTFKCIRPATGRFLPLFSQGLSVCLSPPCSDESRIRLQIDDIIKVTRMRKHWLFGERVVVTDGIKNEKEKHRTGAIRGWFPRRCVIELIELEQNVKYSDTDEMNAEDNAKKSKDIPVKRNITTNGNIYKINGNKNGLQNSKHANGNHKKVK